MKRELPALLTLLHELLTSLGLRPEQFELIRQQALASNEDQTHNPMAQALIKLLRHAAPWPTDDPRYLPTTADGTNFYTVLAFPQHANTTTGVARVFGPLGSSSRWKWTIGGTDTPSFTFAISATADRDA